MTVESFHSDGSCPSDKLRLKRRVSDLVITPAVSFSRRFGIVPPDALWDGRCRSATNTSSQVSGGISNSSPSNGGESRSGL